MTIIDNQVTNNDASRPQGGPGLPSFETSESDDCGEGVHLMGADHSTVADNLINNNSGGILVSDETGPNHDNLITRNVVTGNAYDCGITLASHGAASLANATGPLSFGVYRNTISDNESSSNGLSNGGGAGIGIYAPGPGAQAYGNLIIGNTITGNGLPGVAMHNHAAPPGAPAINFNDNAIIGNTIRLNAADSADAATSGPTGINIYSLAPMTGTVVAQNLIDHESIDLAVNVASSGMGAGPQVLAHLNSFLPYGFRPYTQGVDNSGTALADATDNWWGCSAGPQAFSGCTKATSGVDFMPWLTTAPPSVQSQTGPRPLLRVQ